MFGTKARTGQNERGDRPSKIERKKERREREKPLAEGKEEEERIKEENKREKKGEEKSQKESPPIVLAAEGTVRFHGLYRRTGPVERINCVKVCAMPVA